MNMDEAENQTEPLIGLHQLSTMMMVLLSLAAGASLGALALLARCKVKSFFHRSCCCRCCCNSTANSTINKSSGQDEKGQQSGTPPDRLDGGTKELETSTGKALEQYNPHEDHSTVYRNVLLSTPLRLSSPTPLKVHYRGRKSPPGQRGEERKENAGKYGLKGGRAFENAHQINSLRDGGGDDENDKKRENSVSENRLNYNCSLESKDGDDQTTVSWKHFNDEPDGNKHIKEGYQRTRGEDETNSLSASSLQRPLVRRSQGEAVRKTGIVNNTAERCIHMAKRCIANAQQTAKFHRRIPSRMMYDALLNVRSAQVSLLAAEIMLRDPQAENLVEPEYIDIPDSKSWKSEGELKLDDVADLPSENRTSLSFLSQVGAAGDLELIPVQTPLTKYMGKYASTSKERNHAIAKLNPAVLKVKPFSSSHLGNGSMTDGIKKTLFRLMAKEPKITEERPSISAIKRPQSGHFASTTFQSGFLSRSDLEPKRFDLNPNIKSGNRSFSSLGKMSNYRSSKSLETLVSSTSFKDTPDNKKPVTFSKELIDMYIHIALVHRHKDNSGKSIGQALETERAIITDPQTDLSLRNDSVSEDDESELQESREEIKKPLHLELGRDLKVERSGCTTSTDTECDVQEHTHSGNPDDQEGSQSIDTDLLRSHMPQLLLQIGKQSKQESPPEDIHNNMDRNTDSCWTEHETDRSSDLFKQKHQRKRILLKTLKSSIPADSKANGSALPSVSTSNTKISSLECLHPTCSASDNHNSKSCALQHMLDLENSEIANLSEDSAFAEELKPESGECSQSFDDEAEKEGEKQEKEEGGQECEKGEGDNEENQGELKSPLKPFTTLQNWSATRSWISQSILLMSSGLGEKQSLWQYSANSLPARSKWKSSVSSDVPSNRANSLNDTSMSFVTSEVSKASATVLASDSDASRHLAFRHSNSVPGLSTSLDERRALKNDTFGANRTQSSSGHEGAPNLNEEEYQKRLTSLKRTNSSVSIDLPATNRAKKSIMVEESEILHSKPPAGHSSRHRNVATSGSRSEYSEQQQDRLREAVRRSSALDRILQYEANESFRIPSTFGGDESWTCQMQEQHVHSAENSKDNTIIKQSKTGGQTLGLVESLVQNCKQGVFSYDSHRDCSEKEFGTGTHHGFKLKLCDYTCHTPTFDESSGNDFTVQKYEWSSREVPLGDHRSKNECGCGSRRLDSDDVFENTLSGSKNHLTPVNVSRNISIQDMTPLKNDLNGRRCDEEAFKIYESRQEAVFPLEEVSICMEEDVDRTFESSSLANYKNKCNKQSSFNRCNENSDYVYPLPRATSQLQYRPSDETYTVGKQNDSIEEVDEEEPKSILVTPEGIGRVRTRRNNIAENIPVYTEGCETQASSSPSRLFDNVFRHDTHLPTRIGPDDSYAYSHIHSTSTCASLGCGTSTLSTSACRSPVCSISYSRTKTDPKEEPSNNLSSFKIASNTKRHGCRARPLKSDVPMFSGCSSVRSKPDFTQIRGTSAFLLRNSRESENTANTGVVNSVTPLEPESSQSCVVKTRFVKKTPFQASWSSKTHGSTTRTQTIQTRGTATAECNGAPGIFKKAAAPTLKTSAAANVNKSAAVGIISKRIRELMNVDSSACAQPAAVPVCTDLGCCNFNHSSILQAGRNTSDTSVLGRPCSIMGISTISFSSPATHSTPISAFDRFPGVDPVAYNGQQHDPDRSVPGVEGTGYYRVLEVSESASFYQDPYKHSNQGSAKPCTQYVI